MRNKILGFIGAAWGSAIVISSFFRGVPTGNPSYAVGAIAGYAIGLVMAIAGFRTLYREFNSAK